MFSILAEGGGFELLVPRHEARAFPGIPRIAHRIGSCSASPEALEFRLANSTASSIDLPCCVQTATILQIVPWVAICVPIPGGAGYPARKAVTS